MKFMADISMAAPDSKISYTDRIMLVGSCFTEHIGNKLATLKFNTLQNPHGILFDPISVTRCLDAVMRNEPVASEDIFLLNELWQSWDYHSRFSGIDKTQVTENLNAGRREAHAFLQQSNWLILTLGSSYSYRLAENDRPVANCHRAAAQTFRKHLCSIDETITALDNTLYRLFKFNPGLRVIFTVSPVRHLRDGVVANNRSKARLLEAVHHLVDKFDRLYYFPAYELVIDVLRDYRFYDVDMAHPNYQATEFVLEHFNRHFIDPSAHPVMEQVQQVVIARNHKAFQPETEAHKQFLRSFAQKTRHLQQQYDFLDLTEELAYFETAAQ
ncbi:MAG: GSCFA domain-containing protein [Flavihumibacter sp.]